MPMLILLSCAKTMRGVFVFETSLIVLAQDKSISIGIFPYFNVSKEQN